MSDESLFREVDEEVRREQAKLWDRYGTLLVAVSLLVIIGVAGWKGWQQYWELSRSQAAAKIYFDQGSAARGATTSCRSWRRAARPAMRCWPGSAWPGSWPRPGSATRR